MNSDNKRNLSLIEKIKSAIAADLTARPLGQAAAMAVVSAAVSGASFFSVAYPFGLALVSAASNVLTAAAAVIGTVIGTVGTRDFLGISLSAILLFGARLLIALILSAPQKPSDEPIPVKRKGERLRTALAYDFSHSGAIRPALAGAFSMVSGAISLSFRSGYTVPALAGVFFSAIVTPIAAAAFMAIPKKRGTAERQAGVLLLLFAAARSLHTSAVFPFDAGVLFAFAVPIVIAYREVRRGGQAISATAVTAGMLLGLALNPSSAPIYGAAAIAAGLCMHVSASAAVCAAWLSAMTVAYLGGGIASIAAVMPEITCASAILVPLAHFSLIPYQKTEAKAALTAAAANEAAQIETAKAAAAVGHMEALSAACGELSGVFGALSGRLRRPNVRELKEICDRSTAARCETCENRVLCWEREYATTSDTLCRITAALHRDGRVSAAVIPAHLAARCHHMADILSEVNESCAARAAEAAKTDRTDVLADDLSSFSQILTDAAEGVRAQFQRDDPLSKKLARHLAARSFEAEQVTVYGERRRHIVARAVNLASMKMGNEEIRAVFEELVGGALTVPEYEIDGTAVTVTMDSRPRIRTQYGSATRAAGEKPDGTARRIPNGDTAASFETPDGRYISIISDGMGTGGEAAITSRLSVTFLTKILNAGVSLKNALTMLNNYLRARNMECSAGLDVMELDLYAEEARFVKSGAAPSFVVRDGRLFRLASKTVPIGILRALDAEMIRFTVLPGDTVVMLSDGVMSGYEEASWLCDLLASPHRMAKSPKEIAERIVSAAATESRDDITAAVIKIR